MKDPLQLATQNRTLSESERNTEKLRRVHRIVEKKKYQRQKEDNRLLATKAAIEAKKNSINVCRSASSSGSEKEAATHSTDSSLSFSSTDGKLLVALFRTAPKQVKQLFLAGLQQFNQKKWIEASTVWERIVQFLDEKEADGTEVEKGEWLGDVYGRLGLAYQFQGQIQNAISAYRHVVSHSEEGVTYREPLILDCLANISRAYRNIGAMDQANEYSNRAQDLMKKSLPDDVLAKPATAETKKVHLDALLFEVIDGTIENFQAEFDQATDSQQTLATYVDPLTRVTFLMAVAGQGQVPLLRELIEVCPKCLDAEDIRGHTALAWACKFGHVDAVQYLLAQGAQFKNLNKQELRSWPPSTLFLLQQHLKLLEPRHQAPPFKVAWSKPLSKADPQHVQVISAKSGTGPTVDNSKSKTKSCPTPGQLPHGFNAAPRSEAVLTGKLVGRTLARWDENTVAIEPKDRETVLELTADTEEESWDQFEVNQRLFGVKSTYSEEQYTTKLEKEAFTKEQQDEADRLAAEIMASSTSIEQQCGSLNDDEEGKYGAVLGTGAYNRTSDLETQVEAEVDEFTDAGVSIRNRNATSS